MSSRPRPTSGFGAFRREIERLWPVAPELVVVESTDSTNLEARRSLAAGDADGAGVKVVVAWSQTAGRGRRGRTWSSPPGAGAYASLVTPLSSSPAKLPLLVAVSVCQALESLGVTGCGLKWPNDVVADRRKLGGLLVETVSVAGEPRVAILGVGINYVTPSDPELGDAAVGLDRLLSPLPTLAEVVHGVVEPLARRVTEMAEHSAASLAAAYRALTVHRPGERLVCRTASETVEGVFAGFDERGFLRLAVAGGERLIGSGDVVETGDGRA